MRICIITDNEYLYNGFRRIASTLATEYKFDYFYSSVNTIFRDKYSSKKEFFPICLREQTEEFYSRYDLFISIHCKQLFPKELFENHRCINVHPGFNPYNRGWFPQVFSIINKKPIGVTIHEIDQELDHGPIITQKALTICENETSIDVYRRILELELQLIEENLKDILDENYCTFKTEEGNINYKRDFEKLCKLNLNQVSTVGETIDLLRALTHGPYKNAYFEDEKGKKVYVSINLVVEDE